MTGVDLGGHVKQLLGDKLCNACIAVYGTPAMVASVLGVVYDDDTKRYEVAAECVSREGIGHFVKDTGRIWPRTSTGGSPR